MKEKENTSANSVGSENQSTEKCRPGRPKGSLNKKTLEKINNSPESDS